MLEVLAVMNANYANVVDATKTPEEVTTLLKVGKGCVGFGKIGVVLDGNDTQRWKANSHHGVTTVTLPQWDWSGVAIRQPMSTASSR